MLIITLFGCNDSSPISVSGKEKSAENPISSTKINGLKKIITPTSDSASSQIQGWPVKNAIDGDTLSCWSSTVHTDKSNNTEWISFSFSTQAVNYVKVRPRYWAGNHCLGFPVVFTVQYYNGSSWREFNSFINYPTPFRDNWIILPLNYTTNGTSVTTNGIKITATQLGTDNNNNYVFQLCEVQAGYDDSFLHFVFLRNDSTIVKQNEIQNVGSGTFDTTKLKHWDYDVNFPIISPQAGNNRNIYNPNIVYNGTWNIYFGGWDGGYETTTYDRISITTTNDFLSFSPHSVMIDHGTYTDVNNPSVVRFLNPSGSGYIWLMLYATAPNGGNPNRNKTEYAWGTTGMDWSPNAADSTKLIKIHQYPDSTNANINGSNVLYYQAGTYFLYFWDIANTSNYGVHLATSSDGINYTYRYPVNSKQHSPSDMKTFSYKGSPLYFLVSFNTAPIPSLVCYSLSRSLYSFPADNFLFTNQNSLDQYITYVGLVADNNNRLYGILYGASYNSNLRHHSIFAIWLQKAVVFQNNYVTLGTPENACGPDRVRVNMITKEEVETGSYSVYDCDGTTRLLPIPLVTMRSGDVWKYIP